MASTSQALDALLPSQLHPAKLTSLANSLLAQSRLRAPNLKPEEEIARPYACAEIACSRLRVQLRLPASVKGRPPCKPAVYKKLLAFLEGVLAEQKRTPVPSATSTPKKRTANGALKAARSEPSTPASASKRRDAFVGKVRVEKDAGSGSEAPDWVMPLIRSLCREFLTRALPPHVYTGVCVVLKLADMWPQESSDEEADEFKDSASTLVIAVYLLVLTRMQNGDMTTDAYTWRCGKAVDIAGLGNNTKGKMMVEDWIKRLDREEWCTGQDWWGSVPEGILEVREPNSQAQVREEVVEEVDLISSRKGKGRKQQESFVEEDDDPEGVLLPGLGTMMQDAVDWLGDERKLEYLTWKKQILGKVKHVERNSGKAMAVS